ncbi:hypothetical protein ACFE04_031466 [Oxalis oulophora]
MERRALVVISSACFLALLAAATGFAAEGTRIKASSVEVTGSSCTYPRSPAFALGLIAAVSLMLAQILINVFTGCVCCITRSYPQNTNWRLAFVFFLLSWFTFVIGFLLLLTGAALNDQHGEGTMYFGSYYCYVVKPGVFAGGAVLSLASVTFGILYYLALTAAKNNTDSWTNNNSAAPNQGIAMGHPQFRPPQTTQDPVFVHEDTYRRRQLA